ncbi:HPr kinase/phosphorylase [Rhodospirillum rubrum]
MDKPPPTVHGTAIARDGWAVLLRGPSGSGKSDLALRMIDRGAVLVGDDQLIVLAGPAGPALAPPDPLRGLIEVRGLGLVEMPAAIDPVPLALVVDLVPGGPIERLPDPAQADIGGASVALVRLDPFEASAPVKLDLALAVARGDSKLAC